MSDPVSVLLNSKSAEQNLLNIGGKESLPKENSDGKDDFLGILNDEVGETREPKAKPKSTSESNKERDSQDKAENTTTDETGEQKDEGFIQSISKQVGTETNKALTQDQAFNRLFSGTQEQLTVGPIVGDGKDEKQTADAQINAAASRSTIQAVTDGANIKVTTGRNGVLDNLLLQTEQQHAGANNKRGDETNELLESLGIGKHEQTQIQDVDFASDVVEVIETELLTDGQSHKRGNGDSMQNSLLEQMLKMSMAAGKKQAGNQYYNFSELVGDNYQVKGASELNALGQSPIHAKAGGVETPSLPQQIMVKVPVSQSNWSESIFERVTWLTGQNNKSADIALNPPELGPLEVRVKITGEQASVHFTSHHAAVRDALSSAESRLREMLESNGLTLENMNVADGAVDGQDGDEVADGDETEGHARLGEDGSVIDEDTLVTGIEQGLLAAARGGVDYYV